MTWPCCKCCTRMTTNVHVGEFCQNSRFYRLCNQAWHVGHMAFDMDEEGKPHQLDFKTLTLEKWLQDNSYSFLKNSLSKYLKIDNLKDTGISLH